MTQVNFYSKEQIDEREIGEPTDSASSTGSLWARIKNAIARIVSLESADANNVKKTGTSTVTGTLEVPTTPPTPTSTVNSVYVNDATAGVNNIVHKSGDETIAGIKTFSNFEIINGAMFGDASKAYMKGSIILHDNISDAAATPPYNQYKDIILADDDNKPAIVLRMILETNNKRSLIAMIYNPTTNSYVTTTLASVTP